MGPYGSQDFKTLLLLKIAGDSFQTFFLNFLPNGPHKTTVGIFEILKIEIVMIFFLFSLTWDPIGAKPSKRYSSIKSRLNRFKLFLNLLLSGPELTKVLFWIFEILSFRFLTNFWIAPLYPVGKRETSIIWKTSDGRAKQSGIGPQGWVFSVQRVVLTLQCWRSFWGHSVHVDFRHACISKMTDRRAKRIEIWASGVCTQCVQCTQGIFDTSVNKVILGSFGTFRLSTSLYLGNGWS